MNEMIIFDLDGTLVDTLANLAAAVNYALKLNSFPLRTTEETRKAIGNGTVKLIERSLPKTTDANVQKQVHRDFYNYYLDNISKDTKPYDGICSLLVFLKSLGYKLAVVSNKEHEATIKIINSYFYGLFDYIQGSYLDQPRKPDPYLINRLISESKIGKNKITYIGDTEVDEQSAINADLNYILVSYGYRTKKELYEKVSTKNIVDSVNELYKKIRR